MWKKNNLLNSFLRWHHIVTEAPPPLYKKNKKKMFSVGYLKKQKWDVTNYHIDLIFMMTSQCYRIGISQKIPVTSQMASPPPSPSQKKKKHTHTNQAFCGDCKICAGGGRKPSKKKGGRTRRSWCTGNHRNLMWNVPRGKPEVASYFIISLSILRKFGTHM